MANIPLDDFNAPRVMPRTNPSRVDLSGSDAAGRAYEQAGNQLANVSEKFLQVSQQKRAQKEQEESAVAAAKASNAITEYRLNVEASVANGADQMRRGGDYTKAPESYDKQMDTLPPPQIEGLSPETQERYNGAIANARKEGRLKIDNAVVSARRDEGQSQFEKAVDLSGKSAGLPGANIDAANAQLVEQGKFYIENFGLDASVVNKKIQDRSDSNWVNQAVGLMTDNRDNAAGLKALETALTDPKGHYATRIDTDRKNEIVSRINVRMAQLESKQENEANKREAAGASSLKWYQDQQATGLMIDPTAVNTAREKVRGTESEADFVFAQKTAGEIQAVQNLPFEEQEAYIQQLDTALAQTATKDPVQQKRRIATLETALTKNMELAKNFPMEFIQKRTGDPVPPLDLAALADPSKAEQVSAQIMDRFNALEGSRRVYGDKVGRNPWTKQEAAQIKTVISKLDDEKALAVLGALARSSNSAQNYAGALKPIAADRPDMMIAGLMHYFNPDAAAMVLSGSRALKDKTIAMPSERTMSEAFHVAVGQSIPVGSTERAQMYNAFKYIYASAADKSQTQSEAGEADDDLVEQAIKLATGGVREVNNRMVIIPYNMDPDRFDTKLESEIKRLTAETGYTDLDQMQLEEGANDGEYYFLDGNEVKMTTSGYPIVVIIQ